MGEDLWDERSVAACVVDSLMHQPMRPLRGRPYEPAPAVYALFLDDPPLSHVYSQIERCAWPVYIGSTAELHGRMGRHRRTLDAIPNLASVDVAVVTLPLHSAAAALYAERLAIELLLPCWNMVLPGFSSSRQGRNRVQQRRSPHSVLHPTVHASRGINALSVTDLASAVSDHLARSVPRDGPWAPP
jgi:hypothetical protein